MRLRQPRHGEVPIVVEKGASRGRELRSAESADGRLRIDGAQLTNERARVQIAGRLAARNK